MRHAYGLGEHYNSVERLKDPANAEDSWETTLSWCGRRVFVSQTKSLCDKESVQTTHTKGSTMLPPSPIIEDNIQMRLTQMLH